MTEHPQDAKIARRYLVRGHVQGVGFRYFVENTAAGMGLDGFVRNLDDGSVEVYAIATAAGHRELAGHLWKGPRWAEVRGVDELEASMVKYEGFHIRH